MKYIFALLFLSLSLVLPAQDRYIMRNIRDSIRIDKLLTNSYYKHFPKSIKIEFAVLIPIVDSLAQNMLIEKFIDNYLVVSREKKNKLLEKYEELRLKIQAIDRNSTVLIERFEDLGLSRISLKTKETKHPNYQQVMHPKFKAFAQVNGKVKHEVHSFFITFIKSLEDTDMREVLQMVFNEYFQKKVDAKKLAASEAENIQIMAKNSQISAENQLLQNEQNKLYKEIDSLCSQQEITAVELDQIGAALHKERQEGISLRREKYRLYQLNNDFNQSISKLRFQNGLLQIRHSDLEKVIEQKNAENDWIGAKVQELRKDSLTLDETLVQQEKELEKIKGEIVTESGKLLRAKSANFALIFLFICSIVGLLQEIKNKRVFKKLVKKLRLKEDSLNKCLEELNHRVRNNLQTLISLFSIQESSVQNYSPKMVLEGAKKRLHVMSMLYDHLHFNEEMTSKTINLSQYIKSLILFELAIFKKNEKNVKVHYYINESAVFLNPKSTIQDIITISHRDAADIGVALNELIVNSFKYGLLNQDEPTLFIGLNKVNNGVLIKVKDNGPGYSNLDQPGKHNSFGLKVIEAFTMYGGWFNRYNDKGACSELFFKLS